MGFNRWTGRENQMLSFRRRCCRLCSVVFVYFGGNDAQLLEGKSERSAPVVLVHRRQDKTLAFPDPTRGLNHRRSAVNTTSSQHLIFTRDIYAVKTKPCWRRPNWVGAEPRQIDVCRAELQKQTRSKRVSETRKSKAEPGQYRFKVVPTGGAAHWGRARAYL